MSGSHALPTDLVSQKLSVGGQIELRDIAALKPRSRNPRTHSKKQLQQIADSIRHFGFVSPILIDAKDTIIAGHGRAEGAKLAGLTKVPTLRVDHLSEAEIRAYVIADHKLAENAGWDKVLLALELQELSVEIDFDLTDLGFETPEIDLLLQPLEPEDEPAAPALTPNAEPISRHGDLWLIGDHRLYAGDALDPAAYQRLLGTEKAGCVLQIHLTMCHRRPCVGPWCGQPPRIRHGQREMSSAEFQAFLLNSFQNMTVASRDGALNYICIDWRHARELLEAGTAAYSELKNLCVWAKTNAGMGGLYRSQHELIFVFKHGHSPPSTTWSWASTAVTGPTFGPMRA